MSRSRPNTGRRPGRRGNDAHEAAFDVLSGLNVDVKASTQVFAIAELVRVIAGHIATQDLAQFRLVNRNAGVFGVPYQFMSHCYAWPKSRSFTKLGPKGKQHLQYMRHIVVDTGCGAWSSYGDDFQITEQRKAQWNALYNLLESPELTSLKTVDLKSSIRWATQLDQLTQPYFNTSNRMANTLRSLCLTGITEAMDRYWEISLARPWWTAISNLIERCVEVQKTNGHVLFRHLHIAVEGDATVLCGPPTVGFTTAFRTCLLGELESLGLGKLSYETLRALLGPLNIHPSAQLSQYVTYEWSIWKNLRKLRLSFGRIVDNSASQLVDHVLDHCPVLEELHLGLGPAQPILLSSTLSHLRHLCIEVSELVLGSHIRGAEERERLQAFVFRNSSLLSLSINHTEVRDATSGRYEGKVFSGLPPIQVTAVELPMLRACGGNYTSYRPLRQGKIVYWRHDTTTSPSKRKSSRSVPAAATSQDIFSQYLDDLDTTRLTFLSISETRQDTVEQALRALNSPPVWSRLGRLAELEIKIELGLETSRSFINGPARISEIIALASTIPTVQAILFSPPLGRQAEIQKIVEELRIANDAIGHRLRYVGVGLEIFDRTAPSVQHSGFRRRIGRHHPLRARTLVQPEGRLPLWWGEEFKLREQPESVAFRDAFPSILEHIDHPTAVADLVADGEEDSWLMLPASRTVPTHYAA